MKMKYTAALALLAWLLVVGWLSSMVIVKPAVLRLGNHAEETATMAELRSNIARNKEITEAIATLRQAPAYYGASHVIALPHAAPDAATGTSGASGNRGYGSDGSTGIAGMAEPDISLILEAGGRRTAVINGKLVRSGAQLGNGVRVGAIGADWVRVVDASGQTRTYPVQNPFSGTPEGGMQ